MGRLNIFEALDKALYFIGVCCDAFHGSVYAVAAPHLQAMYLALPINPDFDWLDFFGKLYGALLTYDQLG